MESERELMENRCENKINNLKSSLKKYYSQELEVREITDISAAPDLSTALLSSTHHIKILTVDFIVNQKW